MEYWPLVIFTSLSQCAVGMAIFLACMACSSNPPDRAHWFFTGLIMAVAMVGALFHLGHPLSAYNAFLNLKSAWLSREIMAGSAFSFGLLLAFLLPDKRWPALFSAIAGIALVYAQGITYAAPALTAVANGIPMILFGLTVWILGAALAPILFAGENRNHTLQTGLWVFLAVVLIIPCIWSSGGTIMRLTAQAWANSWPYWTGIACAVAALALSTRIKHHALVALMAFLGILLNRITFFDDTVSTIVNIGKPF